MGIDMKKILLIMLLIVAQSGMAGNCFADTYIAGNFGYVLAQDAEINDPDLTAIGVIGTEVSFKNGVGLSLAVGSETDDIRYEGEFSYRANDMDTMACDNCGPSIPVSGEVTAMSLMGNIYKDKRKNSVVTEFIGVGLGFSKLDVDSPDLGSADDTVFAYQLILGAAFRVNESTKIDVSYRYFATADADFDGIDAEYATHNLMIGARFSF
jgi:outer membrane immunogenic protein